MDIFMDISMCGYQTWPSRGYIHGQMEEKLWAYCGSPFAQSAAFLTGIDIPKKIRD